MTLISADLTRGYQSHSSHNLPDRPLYPNLIKWLHGHMTLTVFLHPCCLYPHVPFALNHVSVLQLYYPLRRVSYERIMLSYPSELDSLIGPVLLSYPWNLVKSPQSRRIISSLSLHQHSGSRSRLSEPQALTYWPRDMTRPLLILYA
ncbi:hypothetical protein QQF64_017933 [Cirrhinus molitorella]|uniref:Uncharacterized protein n=1 Tax=Cirrhinus molitorella TaxID=172907 RepID=A0ABR3LLM8_9TELE